MIYMELSSKALVITGADDQRYWQHMPTSESRLPKDLGIVQTVKMQLWCPQPSGTFPGSEEEKELSQQSAPNALEERKEKVSFANVGLH
ncbi:unnamed protein product [Urochloa humidicola]